MLEALILLEQDDISFVPHAQFDTRHLETTGNKTYRLILFMFVSNTRLCLVPRVSDKDVALVLVASCCVYLVVL